MAGTHRNISPVVQKSCHGHRSSPRSIASQGRHFPGLLGRTIELPAPETALLSASLKFQNAAIARAYRVAIGVAKIIRTDYSGRVDYKWYLQSICTETFHAQPKIPGHLLSSRRRSRRYKRSRSTQRSVRFCEGQGGWQTLVNSQQRRCLEP